MSIETAIHCPGGNGLTGANGRWRDRWAFTAVITCLLLLAGCSNFDRAIDRILPRDGTAYKTSGSLPPLEVPPGLASSRIKDAYPVAGTGSATYSKYAGGRRGANGGDGAGKEAAAKETVLPLSKEIRVERSGSERWLVIDAPPGEVWPKLREFWLENGFLIAFEDPAIGIMETAWAEKREQLPVGAVRRLLATINKAAYSYATRDRFRVRLERGVKPGTTELYISHRGAQEKVEGDTYVWAPRPADPELEAEMLNRLMVSFGIEKQRAATLMASVKARPSRAEIVTDAAGHRLLSVKEGFARAWRRTGLALDRVGFTVADRDRSRGLFFVRYVDPLADEKKETKSWIDKLKFWGGKDGPDLSKSEFLISLVGREAVTQVVVLDKDGRRDRSGTSERILALLEKQLR